MINRKKNLSDYDELMASHCQVGGCREEEQEWWGQGGEQER